MRKDLINQCGQLLIEKRLTIAFAESATAGRLASEFSMVTDAGKFLIGGVVCYDARLKETLLGVPAQEIKQFTPESPEVTRSLTLGLSKLIDADIFIGVTGLTCPGGSENPEKPVGTIFIHAVRNDKQLFASRVLFSGSQEAIVTATVDYIAQKLISIL
ncbi:nicotinamide-nucleotide amidohydrolase family protein [Sphingobacterium alkalisoli]|uniref:Nicotinamide-nucleotide amidohydrolase family protein n=1 Tax=Sphingobacterium alkalisoli TaxID=1874115 RepID=A0A4U0GWH2_9SPHI|nr:nicotinamide-nucleotide amidohydrolase family protein [Sphingobacterium alkalisoli]TJY63437.1 nicotinamide-nucleotide amidohydrolase family protein [Sphingobacterium alkalisoli]GGH26056.1 damage-inducible protein CinA [Sphingobacterium alkalisoli]